MQEVNCLRLTASLQSGEASAPASDGVAAGDAAAPATAAAAARAAAAKEGTVKAEETQPGDRPQETKAGIEAEGKLLRIELEVRPWVEGLRTTFTASRFLTRRSWV